MSDIVSVSPEVRESFAPILSVLERARGLSSRRKRTSWPRGPATNIPRAERPSLRWSFRFQPACHNKCVIVESRS